MPSLEGSKVAAEDDRTLAGHGHPIGPVVRAERPRPRPPLSPERIAAAALALIEEHGLPAFTFRRLGEALGCEAMSVYHYFPSKRHLMDALVAHVLAGIGEPPADLDGIGRLRFLGWDYRAMAHRHPRFFPHAALHRLNMPAGVAFVERMLRHFHAALGDDRLAAQTFRIFGFYVIGAALEETAGYAAGPSSAGPVTDDYIRRECPRLAASAPYFEREYFESTFELGLEMMLKGIADLRAGPHVGLPAAPSFRPAPKPVVRPKT